MEKQRSDLRIMFRDGARPTGNDFTDAFDSFVHRTDDGFLFNSNGAQINNFTLGNFSAVPVAGSMRLPFVINDFEALSQAPSITVMPVPMLSIQVLVKFFFALS